MSEGTVLHASCDSLGAGDESAPDGTTKANPGPGSKQVKPRLVFGLWRYETAWTTFMTRLTTATTPSRITASRSGLEGVEGV